MASENLLPKVEKGGEEEQRQDGGEMKLEEALKTVTSGSKLRRVKYGSMSAPRRVYVNDNHRWLSYHSKLKWRCVPSKLKNVDISEILEVRTGWNTDNFHRASNDTKFRHKAPQPNCFSVVFRHPQFFQKSVDLVADSEQQQKAWVGALSHLVAARKKDLMHFNEDKWLERHFVEADTNRSGSLTFPELWELMRFLNLEISEDYGRKLFETADIVKRSKFGENSLDKEEFLKFFRLLTERPELEQVMFTYSSNKEDFLLPKDLAEFMSKEQGYSDFDVKKAEQLIQTFAEEDNKKALLLGPIGFRRLLMSKWGSILKTEHSEVYQDMTLPLSQYFINSSHNTYLTGLQMRGQATVEGYINALKKGSRLLELDCFDGPDGEPCITHKRTLITPISLRDASNAISQYAFVASPYPVILTIENAVSVEQQRVMADIFRETFGDKLYMRPDDAAVKPLPSPEDLKGRILIRGKKLPTQSHDEGLDDRTDTDLGPVADVVDEVDEDMVDSHAPTIQLDPNFSDIVSIPQAKLKVIADGIREHPKDGSPSLSETKFKSYVKSTEQPSLVAYSADRLVKTYPKGMRQMSSNQDPMESWLFGVQMGKTACMNMQTAGEEMDLVTGLFRQNGNCGFVVKPDCLRQGLSPMDLEASRDARLVLHVVVISGQYLPKPAPDRGIIDPYVTVEIFGVPCDAQKYRTRVIENNGFNPVWNENFMFELKFPELALLRFCVKDYDATSSNDFIGQYTLPVLSIRHGYSHVKLHTGFRHTVDPAASLFVRSLPGQLKTDSNDNVS